MIVTAWNDGKKLASGGGYGFKLSIADRDMHFLREWKVVYLELEEHPNSVKANIDKDSFWGPNCRELINKEIGKWLLKKQYAPWPKGKPPKFQMTHIESNRFKVHPAQRNNRQF